MPKKEQWIRRAIPEKNRGKLHTQLGVPQKQRIPKILLQSIVKAPIGRTISNPSEKGKGRIKVTRLLKKRSNFALNVRRSRG